MAAFIAKAIVAPQGGAGIPSAYTDPVSGLSYDCSGANIHFTDVPASNVFCKHVHYLWAKGIVSGIAPTALRADTECHPGRDGQVPGARIRPEGLRAIAAPQRER